MMSDTGSGIEPSPIQNVTAQYVKIQRQYQQILDRWTPHMLQRWLATVGLLALFFLRIVLAQGVSLFSYLYLRRALNVILMRRLVVHWSVLIFWCCFFSCWCTPYHFSLLYVAFVSYWRVLDANHSYPTCLDAHAIYLLNLLLAFLQPKFDPSLQDDLMADEVEEGGDPITPLPSQHDDEFRPFVRRLPEWQFWSASLIFPLACPTQPFPTCPLWHQALIDSRYPHRLILYLFRSIRCSRLLAHSRCIFLHPFRPNNASTNSVSVEVNRFLHTDP